MNIGYLKFDDYIIEMFLEKLMLQFGSLEAPEVLKKLAYEEMHVDPIGIFDDRMKSMESELSKVSDRIDEYQQQIKDLEEENDEYSELVMEYEKMLSKMGRSDYEIERGEDEERVEWDGQFIRDIEEGMAARPAPRFISEDSNERGSVQEMTGESPPEFFDTNLSYESESEEARPPEFFDTNLSYNLQGENVEPVGHNPHSGRIDE